MQFAFDDEQDLLRSTSRRFLEQRQPLGSLRLALEEPEVFDRRVWRDAAALGWTSMLVPPDHEGGSVTDQPLVDLVVLGEELGRVLHPGPFVPTNVVADVIAQWGTDRQRGDHLAAIARGETVAAWCVTGDGSVDPEACSVTAVRRDDGFVLNGRARFVHGATVADLLLVLAESDEGPLHLLVPAPGPGVEVRVQGCLDLTRRFAEVRFDNVAVGSGERLGSDAASVLQRSTEVATVLQAAEAVGASDRLFHETVGYLRERTQFGRTIASFQAIKHRVADLLGTLEGMRAATHYAALALGDGLDDAAAAVSTAGAYVADGFAHLCGESLQLHGGIGFTWEHDVHLFLRRAVTSRMLYGDPAWHRERLCAWAEAS